MGAIGLVDSVEWSLASSALTKCSSVCCRAINILRSLLKAALACLVLCWRAKNIPVSADRHSCAAGPQESAFLMFQQYSLGHAHWWRSVSSDFSCPWWLWTQALLLHSGVPAHLPDLLSPVPPRCCDTGVGLAIIVEAWSEESGVLGSHRGCVNH